MISEYIMSGNKQAQKLIQASLKGDVSQIEDILSKNVDVNYKNAYSQFPLLVASQHGRKEAVKLLIERGAHVNLESLNKVTALSLASECGHHEIVEILIENGAHVDHQVSDGRTPLMLATQSGHEKTTHVLMSKKASVNKCTDGKQTALTFALDNKHSGVAKLLLPHVDDVNKRDTNEKTPLMLAVVNDLLDVVELLLMNGARIDLRTRKGSTSLVLAARAGNAKIALLLLKYGAEIDLRNDDGYSALIIASEHGHKHFVEVLLNHNAEVDLCLYSTKKTALMVASENGHTEVVKLLLRDESKVHCESTETIAGDSLDEIRSPAAKVNVTATADHQKHTALSLASSHGDLETVEVLVCHGANVDKSVLSRAIRSHNVQVVNFLLKSNASVICCNADLVYACQCGLMEMAKLLIPRCRRLELKSSPHFPNHVPSALWWAINNGHKNVVNLLLDKGASVDTITLSGGRENKSALVIATIQEDVEIVEALLRKGAAVDLDRELKGGETPLMFAIVAGHVELVKLLVSYGANVYSKLFNNYNTSCMDLANAIDNRKIVAILKEFSKQPMPQSELVNIDPQASSQRKLKFLDYRAARVLSNDQIIEAVQSRVRYYLNKPRKTLSQTSTRKSTKLSTKKSAELEQQKSLQQLFPENENKSEDDETSEDDSNEQPMPFPVCLPPTIKDAYKILLPVASKWKNIGVLLGIELGKLTTIETDKKDSQNALLEMIVEWLKKIDSLPTWDELAEAVQEFDQTIAQKIKSKYCDL